jgi:uncharacterized OB-fold protein
MRFLEETPHPDYPLPDVDDPVMRPFWEAARDGVLLLQRDRETGRAFWPPKPGYWKGGGRLEWFAASGRGRIFSYVVARQPHTAPFQHLLPLVLVLVEVEEGPRLVGYMVDCAPQRMSFGMPVRVVFKRLTDRVTLPLWEPAED